MFGFHCRLADNNKHCKGIPNIHEVKNTYNLCLEILADLLTTASSLQCCTARNKSNIHGFKCNCGLWLVFCADLRTTACTEWTFQTYISTNIWWASAWRFHCWLIDNITHSNDISNIHNYKEPMSYVRNCLQMRWQQQALWRVCKHTYLQKHLIGYELCFDLYACEP